MSCDVTNEPLTNLKNLTLDQFVIKLSLSVTAVCSTTIIHQLKKIAPWAY